MSNEGKQKGCYAHGQDEKSGESCECMVPRAEQEGEETAVEDTRGCMWYQRLSELKRLERGLM